MTHLYRYHPQLFATSFPPALNIDTRMVVPSVISLIFRLVCSRGIRYAQLHPQFVAKIFYA